MKKTNPTTSLKGLNLRLTREIYGYAGGEVVTESMLRMARYEFTNANPSRDSLLPGCEWQVRIHMTNAHGQIELEMNDEMFIYDRAERTLIKVCEIVSHHASYSRDYPGIYKYI